MLASIMRVKNSHLTHRGILEFRRILMAWAEHNLHHYSWRCEEYSLFELLVTEILLVRTNADTVELFVHRVLDTYPDSATLGCAKTNELENLLKPFGLHHKRAMFLKELGRVLTTKHNSRVPCDGEALLALPCVGEYVKDAVLCFGCGQRRAIVDVNVARVISRVFRLGFYSRRRKVIADVRPVAACLLPDNSVKTYSWALLDMGRLICRSGNSRCQICPLATICQTFRGQS